MKTFGSEPLKQEVGIVKCKECGKPVLQSAMADHAGTFTVILCHMYVSITLTFRELCEDSCWREERCEGKGRSHRRRYVYIRHQQPGVELNQFAADTTLGKKRKAEDEDPTPEDPSAPKKKKPATKVTKGRTKGPVDFDRQCGVINDKGLPCSRSLTCKSHSMGAKRAVQGRSRPYDELLLEWNRLNNPNFVEPVKRETKQERKERKEKEKAEKKKQQMEAAAAAGVDLNKKQASTTGTAAPKKSKKAATTTNPTAATAAPGAGPTASKQDDDENLDDVDSEAEMDSLIGAVRLAQDRGMIGVPLAVPCDAGSWFVGRRERVRTCRELLSNALLAKQAPAPGIAVPARIA